MKKGLAYFVSSFVLATAFAFGISFQSEANAAQSCQGQCNSAYNACVNRATTTSEKSQCKKSYQGCISSCK
jgi:hypothetical protein